MKTVLVTLLTLGSLSIIAGELVSRRSLEKIEFSHDSQSNTLSIVSSTPLVQTQSIKLSNIRKDRSSTKLFAAISGVTENFEGDNGWGPAAYPFAAIYDIALLPLKAPIKGLKNAQLRKDYRLLMEAINSDVELKVSHNRFERIASLLKND